MEEARWSHEIKSTNNHKRTSGAWWSLNTPTLTPLPEHPSVLEGHYWLLTCLVCGPAASSATWKKKKNEAHPNCQASQTSVPILKVLLSLWGRLVGMLPSTEQWLSYVPLMRNEVRGSFSYMDVRRENTRLRVSIRILYLKAPGVTQEDEKNWRLKCVAPHLCFNFHF